MILIFLGEGMPFLAGNWFSAFKLSSNSRQNIFLCRYSSEWLEPLPAVLFFRLVPISWVDSPLLLGQQVVVNLPNRDLDLSRVRERDRNLAEIVAVSHTIQSNKTHFG